SGVVGEHEPFLIRLGTDHQLAFKVDEVRDVETVGTGDVADGGKDTIDSEEHARGEGASGERSETETGFWCAAIVVGGAKPQEANVETKTIAAGAADGGNVLRVLTQVRLFLQTHGEGSAPLLAEIGGSGFRHKPDPSEDDG